MAWSVTLAGRTFTHVNVEGNAYSDETNGLPAILQAIADEAAAISGIYATSQTTVTPTTGGLQLTTDQDAASVALKAGWLVRVVSAADVAKFMIATVQSFTATTLQLDVAIAVGGEASDWIIGHPTMVVKSLSLDPTPTLSADLDAAGYAITNTSNLQSYAVMLGSAYALSN